MDLGYEVKRCFQRICVTSNSKLQICLLAPVPYGSAARKLAAPLVLQRKD
jgi:hypothetical protein